MFLYIELLIILILPCDLCLAQLLPECQEFTGIVNLADSKYFLQTLNLINKIRHLFMTHDTTPQVLIIPHPFFNGINT